MILMWPYWLVGVSVFSRRDAPALSPSYSHLIELRCEYRERPKIIFVQYRIHDTMRWFLFHPSQRNFSQLGGVSPSSNSHFCRSFSTLRQCFWSGVARWGKDTARNGNACHQGWQCHSNVQGSSCNPLLCQNYASCNVTVTFKPRKALVFCIIDVNRLIANLWVWILF